MRPSHALKALELLLKKPYFTAKEAEKAGIGTSLLHHYVKTGHLKRIRRGLYQSSSYQNPSAFRWGDLIEAVHAVKGGVVCLISALAIYDLSEEIPRQHWIAVSHHTSIKAPSSIKVVRFRNTHLGRTEIKLEGMTIPIFDRERTLIDAFRLLSRETAIKALKSALSQKGRNRIDLIKLQKYAKQLRFDIVPYLMSLSV